MGNTFYFIWETKLMIWLQTVLGEGFAPVGAVMTQLGEEMVLIAIMGFLYWSYDKEYGKYVGINILAGCLWNPMVKNVFLRRRPYFDTPAIKCLKPVSASADIYDIAAQGYSFPSGHSMNSAIAYGSIANHKKKTWMWIVAVLIVLMVGFSRVYLGVHYPTDVCVGWLLGILTVIIVSFLQKRFGTGPLLFAILIASGVPGLFYCTSNDYFTSFGILIGAAFGVFFEEKLVKFSNTRNVFRMILRLILGGGIYFGLNAALKMPFSSEFLNSGTMAARWVRIGRYAIVVFVMLGVYPLLFNVTDKLFKKKVKEV